jgi:hypothetical protein
MLKASALYMVIIIALVIGVLCSALLVAAYFYRLQYQKEFRYANLQNNLNSGINIVLAGEDTSYAKENSFGLFNDGEDSVTINRIFWGAYDIGVVKAYIQSDTLFKAFTLGNTIDSTKWAALYLNDNGRPIAVSGKTMVRGNAYLPRSGVKQDYVDNSGYTGDPRLIIGNIRTSAKILPLLLIKRLAKFQEFTSQTYKVDTVLLKSDSVQNSFLLPTRIADFGNTVTTIKNIRLTGNIIIISDTTLIIDSTAVLNNVLIFARSISVKSGFHGTCQLFATDTIGIAQNCRFDYPSCLGILRFNRASLVSTEEKISFGPKCNFSGLVFNYEKAINPLQPLIHIGSKAKIKGQVYSQGIVELENFSEIDGSVFTAQFLYQTSFTRYENYLTNITIDAKQLSPYYLSSDLIPVATPKLKILQWLEGN